jgi:hypothetical protein
VRGTTLTHRFAFLALLTLAVACDVPPAFRAPAGPPFPVALDVEMPVYVLGSWLIDGFNESLRDQLAKYNVQVVTRRDAAAAVAEIDLGLWGYQQAVDVYVVRGGRRVHAGRVLVVDHASTTLDAAAILVAEVIARAIWAPSPAPPVSASPVSRPPVMQDAPG